MRLDPQSRADSTKQDQLQSAKPQERLDYFKALLEVSDLDQLRNAINDAKARLHPPPHPLLTLLDRLSAHPTFGAILNSLRTGSQTHTTIAREMERAIDAALTPPGVVVGLPARLERLRTTLLEKREAAFPTRVLDTSSLPAVTAPEAAIWEALAKYNDARRRSDADSARLDALFTAFLRWSQTTAGPRPFDCPLCETPRAVTEGRIEKIRIQLRSTEEFRTYRQKATEALERLRQLGTHLVSGVSSAQPALLRGKTPVVETLRTVREMLGPEAASLVDGVEAAAARLVSVVQAVRDMARTLETVLAAVRIDSAPVDIDEIRAAVQAVGVAAQGTAEAFRTYQDKQRPVTDALQRAVDKQINTDGWQDLITLVEHEEELLAALRLRRATADVVAEVERAVHEIDVAKAKVLDAKFSALSGEVVRWWDLLRPGELTRFHGIRRAGAGVRFLDLKVDLKPEVNSSQGPTLRDAVSVLSDSQLNCLGLAAFLARATREDSGFVVLDDPVAASDEEHRATFIQYVLRALLDLSFQVVVLTHDQALWKDLQELYLHLPVDAFMVMIENPSEGVQVIHSSDTLEALLARATPYVENGNPEIRRGAARRLRIAAERFCKELLVRDRRSRGGSVSVSDFDGKALGELLAMVDPLLAKDASDSGKLRVMTRHLSPGVHDDTVPAPGDLKVCLGNLRKLKRDYL